MMDCSNAGCNFCYIDSVSQQLICTHPVPRFVPQSSDTQDFVLTCLTYKPRPWPVKLTEWRTPVDQIEQNRLLLVDEDGLYPGQIKAPIDYSDFDADEEDTESCTFPPPEPESGKDCKT